jgi:hypothetical protein
MAIRKIYVLSEALKVKIEFKLNLYKRDIITLTRSGVDKRNTFGKYFVVNNIFLPEALSDPTFKNTIHNVMWFYK